MLFFRPEVENVFDEGLLKTVVINLLLSNKLLLSEFMVVISLFLLFGLLLKSLVRLS